MEEPPTKNISSEPAIDEETAARNKAQADLNNKIQTEADNNEIQVFRVYVGGLSENITENEVVERFKTFGEIQDSYMPKSAVSGESLYNGSKWKGSSLKIQLAKTSSLELVKKSIEDSSSVDLQQERVKKRLLRAKAVHSENMSLVTDKNIDSRVGWKRGRYGRAIAVVKIRKNRDSIVTVDPYKYKDNLEKLFGSIRPKKLSKLDYHYDDEYSDVDLLSDSDDSQDEVVSNDFFVDKSKVTRSTGYIEDRVDSNSFKSYDLGNPIDSNSNIESSSLENTEDSNENTGFGNIKDIATNDNSNIIDERDKNMQLINSLLEIGGDDSSVDISHEFNENQYNNTYQNRYENTYHNDNSDSDTDIEDLYNNKHKTSTIKFTNDFDRAQNNYNNSSNLINNSEAAVTSNLKSIFSSGTGSGFKLFDGPGNTDISQQDLNNSAASGYQPITASNPNYGGGSYFGSIFGAPENQQQQVETKPMFFEHLGSKDLFHKCRLYPVLATDANELLGSNQSMSAQNGGIFDLKQVYDDFFIGTKQQLEESISHWENQRLFLTRDYKRRHKNAKISIRKGFNRKS
ncbi:Nucleolar protein 8 [Smittium culicis]|uniref:Nucleolar protein 8 n=1 Tax=Smittium culicis TaxID=133412 RepID=A0A1R1X8E5_9FUNG|nr:Nucleolar protein 8 [Smittium culicis]OMJ10885.1 Nucleolar protein 8 [Smittium culicis]